MGPFLFAPERSLQKRRFFIQICAQIHWLPAMTKTTFARNALAALLTLVPLNTVNAQSRQPKPSATPFGAAPQMSPAQQENFPHQDGRPGR
jgi:hypothetical protein